MAIEQKSGQMLITGTNVPEFIIEQLNSEFNSLDIWFDQDSQGIIMDYSSCDDDMAIIDARAKLMSELRN